MFGQDIGVDLGTATILVYLKGKGIVLREPAVVAIDKVTSEILAVGKEASKMLGRTPGNIIAMRPMRDGVISNYTATEKMLKYFVSKVLDKRIVNPRMMICVPSGITEVEKKAVIDAATHAGARKVYLIEEPIAAAIGAGIDITKPYGNLILDIGGGTTDIAVIALGSAVRSKSIRIAGDKIDEAIKRYVKRKHNIIIGEKTAEEIKITIGAAYPKPNKETMNVKGRDLTSGLPKEVEVSSEEIEQAILPTIFQIIDALHAVLEDTPPELCADIVDRGIYLTGGGALIEGLDKIIQEKTGINVIIADDAVSCVALGTGKALEHIELLQNGNAVKIKKF